MFPNFLQLQFHFKKASNLNQKTAYSFCEGFISEEIKVFKCAYNQNNKFHISKSVKLGFYKFCNNLAVQG